MWFIQEQRLSLTFKQLETEIRRSYLEDEICLYGDIKINSFEPTFSSEQMNRTLKILAFVPRFSQQNTVVVLL